SAHQLAGLRRARGERAAEVQAGDVTPEVALQPPPAERREQPLLVVDLVAGEQPVAPLAGGGPDHLGERLAHGGREVEVGFVESLDPGHLAARRVALAPASVPKSIDWHPASSIASRSSALKLPGVTKQDQRMRRPSGRSASATRSA